MFVQQSGVMLMDVYTDALGSIGCGGLVGSILVSAPMASFIVRR